MGFAEDFATTGLEDILDYQGEMVTYVPASGSSRSVTALITHRGTREVGQYLENVVEVLRVSVLKDESNAYGGVSIPRVQDAILRSGDTVPFSFINIAKNETFYYELEFHRDVRHMIESGVSP